MLVEVGRVGTRRAGSRVEVPGGGPVEILSGEALGFVADLHEQFNPERQRLLAARGQRQRRIDAGEMPDFLAATEGIRRADWSVAPVADDLRDRRVEITGPTDRKMMINALNSGAGPGVAVEASPHKTRGWVAGYTSPDRADHRERGGPAEGRTPRERNAAGRGPRAVHQSRRLG